MNGVSHAGIGMTSARTRDRLVQRLQEQCTNPSDEHRRIGVDTPDRILLAEPSFAGAPDLGMLCLEVTSNPVPHGFRDGGAGPWECSDHHIAERMRLRKAQTAGKARAAQVVGGTLPTSGTMIHITR